MQHDLSAYPRDYSRHIIAHRYRDVRESVSCMLQRGGGASFKREAPIIAGM